MSIDYSLIFITDDRVVEDEPFFEILHAALEGGVSMVQLREKTTSTREMYKRAHAVQTICRKYDVPFVVNDRVDIALSVDADGVHVGQSDMPVNVARKLLGRDKILGLSVSTNHEVVFSALDEDVDYFGVCPIFPTNTKADVAQPLGAKGFAEICALTRKPLVAVGGISTANAQAVMDAGANGIGVISAISQAESPLQSSKTLRKIVCKQA